MLAGPPDTKTLKSSCSTGDRLPARAAHVTTIAESLAVLLGSQLGAIGAAGYDVAGISAPGPAARSLGVRHIAVPFVRSTGLTPFSDLRALSALLRIFRRERFTIVHTHTAKPDLYAAIAARVAGVPIVVSTLHGFYFHDLMPRRKRRFWVALARLGMRFCDAVLSQNPEDVETAVRERICPPGKIELLGNGIDVVRFDRVRVDEAAVARLRAELGLQAGWPVVGFVGRLVAEKGVLELLQAAREVRAAHPRVRLLLVGMFDQAKRDAVSAEAAAAHGVADICTFAGHREDMPELYSLMDLLVLPSHREGFPRTPMEAAAMGVPVVATDIRGCRTAVEDGRNGVLVPLKNAAALAGAMASLLGDPERCRAMGREGRLIALERFDERAVFAKVLATYERLLAAKGLPRPTPLPAAYREMAGDAAREVEARE